MTILLQHKSAVPTHSYNTIACHNTVVIIMHIVRSCIGPHCDSIRLEPWGKILYIRGWAGSWMFIPYQSVQFGDKELPDQDWRMCPAVSCLHLRALWVHWGYIASTFWIYLDASFLTDDELRMKFCLKLCANSEHLEELVTFWPFFMSYETITFSLASVMLLLFCFNSKSSNREGTY